jgi:hypothetical protein
MANENDVSLLKHNHVDEWNPNRGVDQVFDFRGADFSGMNLAWDRLSGLLVHAGQFSRPRPGSHRC